MYKSLWKHRAENNWGNWSEKWLSTQVVLEEWVGINGGRKWEGICRQKEPPRAKTPWHEQTFPSSCPLITCTTSLSCVHWKYWFLVFSSDIEHSVSGWGQRNCICIKPPWRFLPMQRFKKPLSPGRRNCTALNSWCWKDTQQ